MFKEKVDEALPGDNVGFSVRGIKKKDVKKGEVWGEESNQPPTACREFKAQVMVLKVKKGIKEGYCPVIDFHTLH